MSINWTWSYISYKDISFLSIFIDAATHSFHNTKFLQLIQGNPWIISNNNNYFENSESQPNLSDMK